jgi:hypothetical protein
MYEPNFSRIETSNLTKLSLSSFRASFVLCVNSPFLPINDGGVLRWPAKWAALVVRASRGYLRFTNILRFLQLTDKHLLIDKNHLISQVKEKENEAPGARYLIL